jgi:hypothetical protein
MVPGDVELHLGVEDDFRVARNAHPGVLVNDLDPLVVRFAVVSHRNVVART